MTLAFFKRLNDHCIGCKNVPLVFEMGAEGLELQLHLQLWIERVRLCCGCRMWEELVLALWKKIMRPLLRSQHRQALPRSQRAPRRVVLHSGGWVFEGGILLRGAQQSLRSPLGHASQPLTTYCQKSRRAKNIGDAKAACCSVFLLFVTAAITRSRSAWSSKDA